MQVKLERDAVEEGPIGAVVAPYYPKEKDESWSRLGFRFIPSYTFLYNILSLSQSLNYYVLYYMLALSQYLYFAARQVAGRRERHRARRPAARDQAHHDELQARRERARHTKRRMTTISTHFRKLR